MKKKIKNILIIWVLMFTLFSTVSTTAGKQDLEKQNLSSGFEDRPVQDETLTFGSKQDISTLDVEGILTQDTLYQDEKEETLSFYLKTTQCKLYRMNKQQVYVDIEGLKPFGSPGYPMLPMKTIIVELPKNAEIVEIGIVNGFYQEIRNKLEIIPNPQPMSWPNVPNYEELKNGSLSNINFEELSRSLLNREVYNSDRFYPGTIVSYEAGEDNKQKLVYIRIYPIQYIPKTKRAVFISQGEIKVYYSQKEIVQPSEKGGSDNIIITHPSLYKEALALRDFHNAEGTTTSVVNTTWIYDNYEEADEPPYEGYSNSSLWGWDSIHGYNYSLARRIISFLKDSKTREETEYITILGNARLVPPSYYYYFPAWFGEWVPTDFFYMSPDYDFVPNFFVGRLPVNNSEEAAHVINKIKNWRGTTELFRNITVAGAKPWGTPYDFGEMCIVDAINRGFFKGVKPTKCFGTEDSFDKNNLTYPLMGDTGLLYHFGHGIGDAWHFERGPPLGVEDVLALPPSNTIPVVISPACFNGMFDTHLVDKGFYISFGESLLLSDAGGIAYIGGTSINYGGAAFSLENGYVKIFKELYMCGMLTYVLESYHDGGETLGELTTGAVKKYVERNDHFGPTDELTVFAFILLGDPALRLPARPSDVEYQTPYSNVEDPVTHINVQLLEGPLLPEGKGMIPLNTLGKITINSSTDSPTVGIKIIEHTKDIEGLGSHNRVVKKDSRTTLDNRILYSFVPDWGAFFSVRIIADDGREGWLYVGRAGFVDDDYTDQTEGIGETKWKRIQDAIESIDDYGENVIYVFNGAYHENMVLDKDIEFLLGEDKTTTMINGNGYGDVVNIKCEHCTLIGFTITNSGKNIGDAGIEIISGVAYVINNIVTHGFNGICTYDGGVIRLFDSDISNNTYGVAHLAKPDLRESWFGSNTICDNKYGIYISNSIKNRDIISGNAIKNNNIGIYLHNSIETYLGSNNIVTNGLGVYLEESNKNHILFNNFIDNEGHAQFLRCRNNNWKNNYWDDWIGLLFESYVPLPKIIFGKAGLLGMMPWIDVDPLPLKIPYGWWEP